jgi:hypothetical protein
MRNDRSPEPFRSGHIGYYFDLPAKVLLVVLVAALFVALGPRSSRLKPIVGPVGLLAGVAGLIGLPAYLMFYTGGI